MKEFAALLSALPEYQQLLGRLQEGRTPVAVTGVSAAH